MTVAWRWTLGKDGGERGVGVRGQVTVRMERHEVEREGGREGKEE